MCPERDEDVENGSPVGDRPVILVAEDDVLIRMGISDYLRNAGFAVLEAADAEEARVLLATGAPVEAVFSDIYMQGPRDGVELALWLELHHPDLPVLLTSGVADAYREAAEACANVHGFVVKPYDYSEVEGLLRSLVIGRKNSASK